MNHRIGRWFVRRGITAMAASFCLYAPIQLSAQETTATDVRTFEMLSRVVAAMNSGVPVVDATIAAGFRWTAGSEEHRGSATLKALGPRKSKVSLLSSDWSLSELRDDDSAISPGIWIDEAQNRHPLVLHNTLTDPVWFFPLLSALQSYSDPSTVFTYRGTEVINGADTAHFTYWRKGDNGANDPVVQRLSKVDMYVDANSQLPLQMAFDTHPDNDPETNLRVEIRYSDYRNVSGTLVPFRIQKFLNGALVLDLAVTAAQMNSGLSTAEFSY